MAQSGLGSWQLGRINAKPPPYLVLSQKILVEFVLNGRFLARNLLLLACEGKPERRINQSHGYEKAFRLSSHATAFLSSRPSRPIAPSPESEHKASQTNTLEGFAEWNSGTAPVIERSAQCPPWVRNEHIGAANVGRCCLR
jgi:hypothetical protein